MIDVVVSTKPRVPCPEMEYHYPKLQNAEALKSAFQKSSDLGAIRDLIDTDCDVVGFDIKAKSVDVVAALVNTVLGDDHGLMIYNPYAPKP